jgi:hypothetical protein
MKKEDIATELTKLVQEKISAAKLDSKDQALIDLLLEQFVSSAKERLSEDAVHRAKRQLLRKEDAAVAELQKQARQKKQVRSAKQPDNTGTSTE